MIVIYCSQCGSEVNENDKFCSSCGAELNKDSAEEVTGPDEKIDKSDANNEDDEDLDFEDMGEDSDPNLLNSSNKSGGCLKSLMSIIAVVVILAGLGFAFGDDVENNSTGQTEQANTQIEQTQEVVQKNDTIDSEDQSLLNEILEGDNEMTKKDKANYKAIRDFIDNNKNLGKFTYFEKKEPWMHGDRYSVSTSEDTFLFYLYNEENKVVSVNVKDQNDNIQNIYREEVPDLPDNFKRKATEVLPEYIIIDQLDLTSGGRHGDILIKSFSKETSLNKREKIIKKIIEKENFTQADLYCTREAFEANMNSSYSESHPNALKNGYLGSVRDNKFSAPYN